MSTNHGASVNRVSLIKWIITILIPLILLIIPSNELYTDTVKKFSVITIFFLLVIAFEFFDNIIPAILMPACWAFLGVANFNIAFSGFTNTTVFMVFGAFVFANALEEVGLLRRIAYYCIYRVGGSFKGLMIGSFIAGVILSFITFGFAYVIMGTLIFGICNALNLEKGKTSSALMMSVILGTLAVRTFIYNPAAFAMISSQARIVVPGFDITMVDALLHQWPVALFCIILLLLFIKMYKPSDELSGGSEYALARLQELGPITVKEKKAIVVLFLLLAYLLTSPLHGMATYWGFLFFPWLFFMPGINVSTAKGSIKKVNYSMIFFMASCISIGTVATSLNIGKLIAGLSLPVFNSMETFSQLGFIYLLTFLLNFVMTPLAIMSTLTVPLCEIAAGIGTDPRVFVYTILHGIEALVFPYEYVAYLVVYSFGMMTMKEFIKMNVIRTVLCFLGLMFICIPYWMLIGLM